MREILDDIDRWRSDGKKVAVARVVKIEGSGPRDPGAAMAVNEDSEALAIIGENAPGRMVTFGYSDDEAFAVGLTCGGIIRLYIEQLDW
jgi:xanthine dehydrogenase accessory factor